MDLFLVIHDFGFGCHRILISIIMLIDTLLRILEAGAHSLGKGLVDEMGSFVLILHHLIEHLLSFTVRHWQQNGAIRTNTWLEDVLFHFYPLLSMLFWL